MADCKRCFLGGNDDCYPHVAEDKECDIFRPMTNADRIRAMNDEELAEWLASEPPSKSKEWWINWLKQECAK